MNNLPKYNVIYKKRKTIGLEIKNNGTIEVKAPIGTKKSIIDDVLTKKELWINSVLKKLEKREYLKENEIMLYGKIYKIIIKEDKEILRELVKISESSIFVYTKNKENVKFIIKAYLKKMALNYITKKVYDFKDIFKIEPKTIKIKEQKSIWGSCSYDNKLSFNYKLVMAESFAIDYVIIHEMCHMIHKNHSKEYWNLVESIMPDYRIGKGWLTEYGYLLDLQ